MAGKGDLVEKALKAAAELGEGAVPRIKLRGSVKRSEPDWDAIMSDIEAQSDPHPFAIGERIYNDRSTFDVSPFGETLHLGDIRALKPNQGAGTELIDFLKGIADKHDVPITGVAKVYHSSPGYISDTEKLADWYRKRGFEIGDGYPEDGYEIRYNPRITKDGGGEVDPYAEEVASAKKLMEDKRYAEQPWSEWAGDAVNNALNTAKAILPTALGGEGKVGITDIAKGAYESGKDALTLPGDALTGKLNTYDERGNPSEEAIRRSNNFASTMAGGSSFVERPSNSLGVFAGIRSRTADKNALTKAQIMESQAAVPDDIWRQSGWGRGAEGAWRYEIPDTGTTVDPSKFNLDLSSTTLPSGMRTTLGEYINHPELFDAYPEFKNMPVKGYYDPNSDTHGYYMPRSKTGASDPYIALNLSRVPSLEDQRNTLLHEIQHAIQQKEGFVPGTNVRSRPPQTKNPMHSIYQQALANDRDMQILQALRASPEFQKEAAEKSALFDEYKKKIAELDAKQATTGVDTKNEYIDATNDYFLKVKDKFPLSQRAAQIGFALEDRGIPSSEPKEFLEPFDAYWADAGEVEARNVQGRRDAPREELKERPPWRTQDKNLPYEGQLIDWNDTSWRKGYANKGRVAMSALDRALQVAREGLEGLAKNKGRTAREIGEPYGSQLPRVPFEEWRYEYQPTTELLPRREFDPSSMKEGDIMIPFIGDRTSAGRKIISINDQPLAIPGMTEGGPDYARSVAQQQDNSIWASGKGAVSSLNRRINNALNASRELGYKDPNAYGVTIAMSPQGGDFAAHVAETYMGMIPNAKITKKAAKEFDDQMRQKFADWPGILSDRAADYVINAEAGAHRVGVLSELDKAKWTKLGFPDVSLARYATTTPDLIDVPTESAGYMIGRIDPSMATGKITAPHRTYDTTIPGEYVGGLPPGMMRDDVFTQFSRAYDENPAEPSRYVNAKRRAFEKNPMAFQVMEGRDIEDLIRKVTALKSEYADGGEVDDDIYHAVRLAREEGGATNENPQVFLTDAQGRQYDAQGKPIQPAQTQEKSNVTAAPDGTESINKMFNAAPQNYQSEVQPFIDYAVTPIDRPGMPSEPDLVDVMRIATQVAAEGQPTDDRGEGNLARRREEAINKFYGADPEQPNSPASNQAWVTNRMVDFSPLALGEIAHDIPYEAGRTGDYGTAAVEGGINALLTAPVMGAVGRGLKKGYEYAKQFPLLPAAVAGAAGMTAGSDEAEAGPARWYSKLLEAAHALPMEKMTGEQALAMLRKGVSPEELLWTGTENLLTSTPRISKGELIDHISRNRLKVNEVMLGGDKPSDVRDVLVQDIPKEIRDKYMPNWLLLNEKKMAINAKIKAIKDSGEYIGNPAYIRLTEEQQKIYKQMDETSTAMRQEYVDSIGGLAKKPKYESYSTQGGKGYRENLYTLGAGAPPRVEQRNGMWSLVDENGNVMRAPHGGEYTYWSENDANRAAKSLYRESGRYRSSHWDDPNVLFHTRSQTLTYDPPGANRPYRVHNVDETQSDWGQEGRRRGFYDRETYEKWRDQYNNASDAVDEASNRLLAVVEEGHAQYKKIASPELPWRSPEYQKWHTELQDWQSARPELIEARKALREAQAKLEQIKASRPPNSDPTVPELAPFVSSTEGWTDRAIKHELDKALDNGSDYFSWSPGAVHADRYDLSRHIGSVQYDPYYEHFHAYDPSGRRIVSEGINNPDDLDNYVGKELGDKIRSIADERKKAFYDGVTIEKLADDKYHVLRNGKPTVMAGGYGDWFETKSDAAEFIDQAFSDSLRQDPIKLEGLDLRTGGEGMIGYYDKVYLKRVQDVLKKATGEKPIIEEIEVQTADGPRKQLGIRLTDEMRAKARFSDFKRGGTVTGSHSYDTNDAHVNHALALTREF